jgi:hypothetical protein
MTMSEGLCDVQLIYIPGLDDDEGGVGGHSRVLHIYYRAAICMAF